jgi:outer membrane protein OmpA-like peptidoglycan-associated protein
MRYLATITLSLALISCATAGTPQELVDARAAYTRAEQGPAAKLKPDELHQAKVSLDQAEASFKSDSDSQKTRDLAYVAERNAQLADADGKTAAAINERNDAALRLSKAQGISLEQARAQLALTQKQLDQETHAREQAEASAREAMLKLTAANVAAVKDEPRGTVIVLPGSVLFASGKSTLLPSSQQKLDQVADALKEETNHHITVEGYTDSRGSDAANQALSERRANAVRNYLVTQGVAADQIDAVGLGASKPTADNSTAEGRATNRRVEIVVKPIESTKSAAARPLE